MEHDRLVQITCTVNGEEKTFEAPGQMSALEAIRDILGLTGSKEGCGEGECGACTIEVDGQAVNACLLFAAQLDGTRVLTVEGLQREDGLHPIQEALLDHHGVQCGFCTPGILMSTHALMGETNAPSDEEITQALAGNLCRCTGYRQIFSSVKAALDSTKESRHD